MKIQISAIIIIAIFFCFSQSIQADEQYQTKDAKDFKAKITYEPVASKNITVSIDAEKRANSIDKEIKKRINELKELDNVAFELRDATFDTRRSNAALQTSNAAGENTTAEVASAAQENLADEVDAKEPDSGGRPPDDADAVHVGGEESPLATMGGM